MDSITPTRTPGHSPEEERTRELYKYFLPRIFEKESKTTQPASRDTVLTSYAQLIALRLDARRCTMSYFDADTQYNVAEATKTLLLDDGTSAERKEDDLWLGATRFNVNGSVCLHTLAAAQASSDDNHIPDFEVTDLAQDVRFSGLPFVTGGPKIRYYYGTTFSTKKGVAIGTVCILDDKVRRALTAEQRRFMHTIANNVMLHLELLRERAERKRATKMNQCLNMFINPDSAMLGGKRKRRADNSLLPEPRRNRTGSTPYPLRPAWAQSSPKKRKDSQASDMSVATDSSESKLDPKSASRVTEDEHLRLFSHAAQLLRTSLDIEGGGGVIFMDTTNSGPVGSPVMFSNPKSFDRSARRGSIAIQVAAEVLASSTTADSIAPPEDEEGSDASGDAEGSFTALPVEALTNLVARYPQGKLWVYDANGASVSGSESESSSGETQLEIEATTLLQYFPHAQQIISLPLWDPRSSRWTVCFAFSTSKYRTLNADTDFLFCVAFCNCITIESARLATLASDQLKGDFISSISHELRSPLHAIMASVEFLQDTETSSFQQSLIHTVNSCARTLLDTISMILDYTKINAFERDWQTVAKKKKEAVQATSGEITSAGAPNLAAQPALNIYGNVDLAAVTEEVVEGVTAGQEHQNILTVNFADSGSRLRASRTAGREPAPSGLGLDGKSVVAPSAPTQKGKVEVILDIEPRSWAFVTQPGAFRRIVMNLVGNSLKYTTRGWIRIHLDIEKDGVPVVNGSNSDRDAATELVVLTVTDTGKGISSEYLRTKLFQAFAQEDHLASGTGLGLSLVRSILKLLNGDIDIVSTVGVGTKCTVRIPMIPQSSSTTNTPSTGSSDPERARDDSVATIKRIGRTKKFAIFKQNDQTPRPLLNGLNVHAGVHGKIRKYVVDWYHLSLTDWSPDSDADIVVVDEEDLAAFISVKSRSQHAAILVYCMYANRPALLKAYDEFAGRIDFMSKPFGPYKLARALCSALERSPPEVNSKLDSIVEPVETKEDHEEQPPLVEGKLTSGDVEVNILQSGSILAKDDSTNARMAVGEMDQSPPSTGTGKENREPMEFPFMDTTEESLASPGLVLRPALRDRRTMSPTASEIKTLHRTMGSISKPVTSAGVAASETAPQIKEPEKTLGAPAATQPPVNATSAPIAEPRLLLVDDNNINLHLLQTYMKKRKYKSIHSASDGLEAVQRFEALSSANEPPDIIFMDISMPVMNGFDATRKIRAYEESRNADIGKEEGFARQRPSALIIALTGLASSKDQSEAFIAGVDLYMTKPVSFKEVGRLLDNWIRNGGAREAGDVPFGAAVPEREHLLETSSK